MNRASLLSASLFVTVRPAVIEEFVIWARKRDFLVDQGLLAELKRRGFEPQIVGEIDPPPKNGGSWVLRDKRDRRASEDGGVWISWARPRGGEGRDGFSVRYVIETFDGRSGWDWFLSCAIANVVGQGSQGKVSADGGPERDASAFSAELAKDPSSIFQGPESVVDWESKNLDEGAEEEDDDAYEEEDTADSEDDDEDEDGDEDAEDEGDDDEDEDGEGESAEDE